VTIGFSANEGERTKESEIRRKREWLWGRKREGGRGWSWSKLEEV